MKQPIYPLLRKRFPENEYALMGEVRDKTGGGASRSADFIAVNLWPSRGLAVNGIELKSHRGDWLRELKNPAKADKIFKYCDYFWLLTDNDDVAKLEEIPDSWGWIVVKNGRLVAKKQAPKLTPEPLPKEFVCAMLKRAVDKSEFIHRDDIQERIKKASENSKIQKEYHFEQAKKQRDEYHKIIQDFKESSGIDLFRGRWGGEAKIQKLGEVVKFLSDDGGVEQLEQRLLSLETTATGVLEKIVKILESIKKSKDE